MKLNDDFLAQLREATALLRTSGPAAATAAIQRALGKTDSPANDSGAQGEIIDINPVGGAAPHTPDSASDSSSAFASDSMPESQPASYRSRFMDGLRYEAGCDSG